MSSNRNELIRRLLSGITDNELQNLVRVREKAKRSIPAKRIIKVATSVPAQRTKKVETPVPAKRIIKVDTPIPAPRFVKVHTSVPARRTKKVKTPVPAKRIIKVDTPITPPRTDEELQNLVREWEEAKLSIPAPRTKKVDTPIPAPRTKKVHTPVPARRTKKVDTPIPPPRTKKVHTPIPPPRTKKVDTPIPPPRTKKVKITEEQNSMKNNTQTFDVSIKNDKFPLAHMQKSKASIRDLLKKKLKKQPEGFKFYRTVKSHYLKSHYDPKKEKYEDEIIEKTYKSKAYTIRNEMDIEGAIDKADTEVINATHDGVLDDSNIVFGSLGDDKVELSNIKIQSASSYMKVPQELRNSQKGLINLQNKDNECFRWCHIRYLNPQTKDPQRIKKSDTAFVSKLNYEGITFPVKIADCNKIEKLNNIRINIFGYTNKAVYGIYISKEKYEKNMNLLFITDDNNSHYVLIKDFNRLMFNITKSQHRQHFCMFCLQHFSTEQILERHKETCIIINGTQTIKLPDKSNNKLLFSNFKKEIPAPFVIYAHFEALTEKIQGCTPNNDKSYTHAYQKHTDCGYGYKVVCCYDDKYTKPVKIYRGENAVYQFMTSLLDEVKYCKWVIKNKFNEPMQITEEEEKDFKAANSCHICGKEYKKDDIRVRDHCHVTGKFRGSTHQDCNLHFTLTTKIPVIFHNLRGYDSHFIMQQLGQIVKNNPYINSKGKECFMSINAIPNNMEKYLAFMLGFNLVFIDSFQFMSTSLNNLVNNLPRDSFKYTSKQFENEKFDLMIRKGVYPYDFMDSFDRFDLQLPTKDKFYSQLTHENISDEDYKHAQKVWETFQLKNMGEYHDLYLKSDVLLLTDVFENFRKTCSQYYKLDPCHYFTAPGFSWDAMLKMTGIKLELMTDIDMYQFIEKGMRGGVSYIAHRYSKANNKYMPEYDATKPSKHIMYLDANNLYGLAMSQYLPTGGFKWLTQKRIDELNIENLKKDSKKGLILEVDLEYPKELHNLHNDYPVAPEKIKVNKTMLSSYCRQIAEQYKISFGKCEKLIPNLGNKEKYVVHYRNLQLYLSLGLKLTKIHRALEFNQSPWLKRYIDFNTEKRKMLKMLLKKTFLNY